MCGSSPKFSRAKPRRLFPERQRRVSPITRAVAQSGAFEPPASPVAAPAEPATGVPPWEGRPGEEIAFSKLNLIGQLANSFILLESLDGLVLIDQHAAHERIVFSSFGRKKTGAAQLLTRAAVVDLLPKEAVLLRV